MRHAFFERCIRMLESLSGPRKDSETPQEYTQDVSELLAARGQTTDGSLSFLTDLYYRLRFGRQKSTTTEERAAIDDQLKKVEKAVASARR